MVSASFFQELAKKAHFEGVEIMVASGVVTRGDRVLLVRRSKDDFLGGLLEIPGGKVERGETIGDAVKREVLEETGLKVTEIVDYLGFFEYSSRRDRKCRQFNFEVRVKDDSKITLTEHDRYIWATEEDAEDEFVSDKLKAVLRQVWTR